MKICLIIPPSAFLLDERVFMTLGILRVAAVLEKACHEVDVLDLSGIENYRDAVLDYVAANDTGIFGLTATTPQVPATVIIADAIHWARPDAHLILGGPHITLVNAARKKGSKRAGRALGQLLPYFRTFVCGDGERAIFEALKNDGMNPIIDADEIKSELFLTNKALTNLPRPARHLVDVDSYHYTIDGVKATSLIAQLGCPFGCGFCGGRLSPSLRKIRMRTTESIIMELRHLYETYGFTGFMFYDDELNVNPGVVGLMKAIARLADELKVEFKLRGFVKAELFTVEQAQAMWDAGFRWILTGFESGSPRILKNIQKKATRDDNTRCMEIAKRQGLKVKALMSLGHPGESPQTVQDTQDWLVRVKPDDFDATIITPYPGSPYYDQVVEVQPGVFKYVINGDALYQLEVDYTKIADYYKGDPNDGYVSYVWTDFLDRGTLVAFRDRLEHEVRTKLSIPFNPSLPAQRYEHSMGQLPTHILKPNPWREEAALITDVQRVSGINGLSIV